VLLVVHLTKLFPYKIDKERTSEDDNDDCAEADGDTDLMME